jgi:hypothetical protein
MSNATNAPLAPESHSVDDLAPVASYFGVDKAIEASKLSTIARNLRGDTKEMDEIDLMKALRDTMWKLGDPPLGSTALDHAYEFAKLDNQIRSLEEEKAKYVK